MYIGIDHGTTAIRFACEKGHFRISREDARFFKFGDLEQLCPIDEIQGLAVCYSMGDGISKITAIEKVRNRGVVSLKGAGEHIGGGTKVYDEVAGSGIPAIVIPGLHRESPTDPRFKAYSHQTSPEKIGIAYQVLLDHGGDFVVADVSSNTVTMLVSGGKIVGAFDACIFSPGTKHGALDVDAIRKIDAGEWSANEAFLHAGLDDSLREDLRNNALAMFAAMECASMKLLSRHAKVALAGSMAPDIAAGVEELLLEKIYIYDEWCAATGLWKIARDVFEKKKGVLGLGIEL